MIYNKVCLCVTCIGAKIMFFANLPKTSDIFYDKNIIIQYPSYLSTTMIIDSERNDKYTGSNMRFFFSLNKEIFYQNSCSDHFPG